MVGGVLEFSMVTGGSGDGCDRISVAMIEAGSDGCNEMTADSTAAGHEA